MDIIELLFKAKTKELDDAEKKLDDVGSASKRTSKDTFDLSKRFDGLSDAAYSAVGKLGPLAIGVTLVATAAVAAVTAIVKLSTAVADAADKMNDLSNRTNVSTERLSLLDAMAKMAGSSVEELVSSSERLGQKLAKQDEESGRAVTALKTLRVSTKDANGEAKSMIKLQEEIVLAVDAAGNSAKAQGAAVQLLGKEYYSLRTAIKEAAESASEMYDFMQSVGATTTTKLAKDSDTLNDNISKLGLAFEGMGKSIASITIPILNRVIESLTRITAAAADIIRRYTGGATGAENANDRVSSLKDDLAYQEGRRGSLSYRNNPEAVEDRIKELKNLIAIAESDVRQAKMVESITKNNVLNGRAGEGNKAVGTDKKAKPLFKGYNFENGDYQDARIFRESPEMHMQRTKILYDMQVEQEKITQKQTEAYQKQADSVRDLINPMRELDRQIQEVNANTLLSEEEKINAVVALSDKYIKAHGDMKKASEDLSMSQRIANTAFKGLEDVLVNLATTGQFSFKSFISAIISDIARLIIQMNIIKPLMAGFASWDKGGGFWSAVAGAFGGAKSADGNVFGNSGLLKSASGNVFDSPTLHGYSGGLGMLGEAGPEAIMPLKRGANGQLGVQVHGGSQGGGVNVGSITVNVKGGESNAETGQVVSKAIVDTMKQVARGEIFSAKRPGGALYA